MVRPALQWLSETKRLALLYLVAAFCFVPTGLVFAYLTPKAQKAPWVSPVLLGSSLIAAYFAWSAVEKRTKTERHSFSTAAAASSSLVGFHFGGSGLVAGAYVCFVLVSVPQKSATLRTAGGLNSNATPSISILSLRSQ